MDLLSVLIIRNVFPILVQVLSLKPQFEASLNITFVHFVNSDLLIINLKFNKSQNS